MNAVKKESVILD